MISIDPYVIEMLDCAAMIDDPLERQLYDAAAVGTIFSMRGVRAILTGDLALAWYSEGIKVPQVMEFLVDNIDRARAALQASRLFSMEEPERFFKAVRTKLPLSLPYFDGWLMSNPRTLDPCLTFGPNLEVLSPEDLMIERIMRNTEEGFRDACLLMRTATSHLDLEHFQERLIEIVRVTPTVYLGELG